MSRSPMRVLFVNSGILGMRSFAEYIREAMASQPDIDARHIVLSENLSTDERVLRRIMCARLWRDGWCGVRNADFARLRHELHAGVQAARRIRRAMRANRADVLHFHRQATAYASVGMMRRVPSIVSIDCTQDAVIDGTASGFERWTYEPNAAMDGAVLSAAAAIVSTSQWAADAVRRRYPQCAARLHVMPTPVRIQNFSAAWTAERAARAVTGYRPRVLFVGGDFPRKGGPDLLAAWRDGGFHERATLDLVTNWTDLRADGVPGVQVHRGIDSYTAEWSALWRAADIFVMPSRSDAFPNVLQEAAAAGLPAVSTRVDAIPELVQDATTGVLVPPGNPHAIAQALQRLLDSPSLRSDMGRAARTRVERTADPGAYREQLVAIVQAAAGRAH
jgi:glycosyltransferase involved in cell wall biosynthesis